jgi:glycosyltransferase involved in cell wall biosynthesis
MIEAMSAGTPVIAWRNGSVPEIIEEGRSGLIVESMNMAVEAVGRATMIDRSVVRRSFERRFTAARMAGNYVKIYEDLIGKPGARPEREAAE